MKGFTFGDDSPFSSFLAQGQTDLEFHVEKILTRSDPKECQTPRNAMPKECRSMQTIPEPPRPSKNINLAPDPWRHRAGDPRGSRRSQTER